MPPIFGVTLSCLTIPEIVEILLRRDPVSGELCLIATMNLDHAVNLRHNADFRNAYRSAYLVSADGAPIYLYARLAGIPLKARVTGADLFADLITRFGNSHRPFFLASEEEAAKRMLARVEAAGISTSQFKFAVPPFGFETDIAFSNSLIQKIRDHRTTHLFICVGSPKSEVWAWRNRSSLGGMYALCFGASLAFYAGTLTRAPGAFRRVGAEWLWRLLMEPRRLFRRYIINSWGFLLALKSDIINKGEF